MSTNERVMESLHELSPEQLRQVRAMTGVLLKGTSGSGDWSDGEVALHTAVEREMRLRGQTLPPLPILAKVRGYAAFRDAAPGLLDYVRTSFKVRRRPERERAFVILVRLLFAYLEQIRVPVGPRTICQHVAKIPDLVERAFPGYRASGLLPVVLRQRDQRP